MVGEMHFAVKDLANLVAIFVKRRDNGPVRRKSVSL